MSPKEQYRFYTAQRRNQGIKTSDYRCSSTEPTPYDRLAALASLTNRKAAASHGIYDDMWSVEEARKFI